MPGTMAPTPTAHQFNPYSENGGTILAIAGADFSVIAGDTRQTEGFNIQTRYAPKVFRLCVPLMRLLPSLYSHPVLSEQTRPSLLSTASPLMEICSSRRLSNALRCVTPIRGRVTVSTALSFNQT